MERKPIAGKRHASRERIISEAVALAEEHGWAKLTVRRLAARLNYAAPVLYEHFQNKEHLSKSIVEEGFKSLTSLMHSAAAAHYSPQEKLINLARARYSFAIENKALHSMMFVSGGEAWQREATFKGMCEAAELLTKILKTITGRKDECRDLLTNYIAIIKGYTYLSVELPAEQGCSRFFGDTEPLDALTDAIKRFILSVETKKDE